MILKSFLLLNLIFLVLDIINLNNCNYLQLKYYLIQIYQNLFLMILNTNLLLNLIFLDLNILNLNNCKYQLWEFD